MKVKGQVQDMEEELENQMQTVKNIVQNQTLTDNTKQVLAISKNPYGEKTWANRGYKGKFIIDKSWATNNRHILKRKK